LVSWKSLRRDALRHDAAEELTWTGLLPSPKRLIDRRLLLAPTRPTDKS